jgi:hypothetical protein
MVDFLNLRAMPIPHFAYRQSLQPSANGPSAVVSPSSQHPHRVYWHGQPSRLGPRAVVLPSGQQPNLLWAQVSGQPGRKSANYEGETFPVPTVESRPFGRVFPIWTASILGIFASASFVVGPSRLGHSVRATSKSSQQAT